VYEMGYINKPEPKPHTLLNILTI